MKIYSILFIAVMFIVQVAKSQTSIETSIQVDNFVKEKMNTLGIPGMAVAVVHHGEVVKLSTYGLANLEWNERVSESTNFQIASCTKLLTSTAVMVAVHQKKFLLTDPISKFIDSIPDTWKGMQIKHLITHSSGLKSFDGESSLTTSSVVKILKDSSMLYPFGKVQQYANYDFTLLKFILEKVYNKSYETILNDLVLKPAGMVDGGFDMERKTKNWMQVRIIKNRAITYYGPATERLAYKFFYPEYTYSAGGYFASIQDLAKWAVSLDREKFLSKEMLKTFTLERDSIGSKLSAFSRAGWVVSEEGDIIFCGHTGGPGLADIQRFPTEGYTFIVLSNDGELLPDFARAIAGFYIKKLSKKDEITKFVRQ